MIPVRWTGPALRDFRNIISWLGERNPNAASKTRDLIKGRLTLLAAQPRIGRIGRVPDTRELVLLPSPYIVIYQLTADDREILVVRVLHSAQRWPPKPG